MADPSECPQCGTALADAPFHFDDRCRDVLLAERDRLRAALVEADDGVDDALLTINGSINTAVDDPDVSAVLHEVQRCIHLALSPQKEERW